MWRFVIPIGLFAALLGFFYMGLGRDKESLPSPLIGKPAPGFEVRRLDGQGNFSTQDMLGQAYVLNVWGSWCIGCRQEHAALMEISRRKEIPIVGLDWNDQDAAALEWLQTLGNPYVLTAVDADGRVAIDYGVYGAPETFLISAQGQVVHKYVGPLDIQVWESQFVPRLKAAGVRTE
jgi:cytochrome c biogenesis protein CcmG, thiol:disulfide interchange protein DsbE